MQDMWQNYQAFAVFDFTPSHCESFERFENAYVTIFQLCLNCYYSPMKFCELK